MTKTSSWAEWTRALMCAGLLMCTACGGPSSEDVINERRAVVEKQIVRVEAAVAELAQLPRVTTDKLTFASVPPDLRQKNSGDEEISPSCNAALIEADFLSDIEAWPRLPIRVSGDRIVNDAVCLTRKGGWPSQGADWVRKPEYVDLVEKALTRFAQLRYVFVLRRYEFRAPKVINEPELDRFSGGHFVGDVVVLDLEGAQHLGGFRVAMGSEQTVEARLVDISGDLKSRLALTILRTIEARIRELVPDAVLNVWQN